MTRSDTARRFLHSAGAATFSQFWRVGVTFLTHLVLRRFIPVEDWGLYDWAEVVFLVLGAVRDLGLPAHTLRVPSRPFGNLLALETGWGAVLSGLVFVGAPLFLLALNDPHPETIPVLRAMALFLLFEGLAAVPLIYFEGELQVRRVVVPELIRNLCYAVTAVSLAITDHGVWSIVVAQILAAGVFAITLWVRAWGKIPLTTLPGKMPLLVRSSVRLAVVWLLILLVRHIDRLIIGARFPIEDLGTYGFAYWTAFIVPMILLQPIGRAVYPALVAFGDRPAEQFRTYRLSTHFLLALEVPAALFLFVNAETVLSLIGGAEWAGAPAYLRVLCFAPLIDPFSRFGGELLATRHRDRLWIVATLTTLLSFLVFGLLFTSRWGPMGMAWANYLPLGGLVMGWAMARHGGRDFGALVRDLALTYAIPVPLFLLAAVVAPERPLLRFGLSMAALLGVAAIYGRLFGAQFREFFRR